MVSSSECTHPCHEEEDNEEENVISSDEASIPKNKTKFTESFTFKVCFKNDWKANSPVK